MFKVLSLAKANDAKLEKVGCSIAAACDWKGYYILKIAFAALEDANFHGEAQLVDEMMERLVRTKQGRSVEGDLKGTRR